MLMVLRAPVMVTTMMTMSTATSSCLVAHCEKQNKQALGRSRFRQQREGWWSCDRSARCALSAAAGLTAWANFVFQGLVLEHLENSRWKHE